MSSTSARLWISACIKDGLVHISRMADKFIRHPSEVVHVGDVVTVWVVDVDVKKQRIALTMVKGRA